MLLSIDPGVNNCGLAVSRPFNVFEVLETQNVKNARKFTDSEKEVEKFYSARVVKVAHILAAVEDTLTRYPDIEHVAIETPFYNALTPQVYGSLLEVISAIRYNVLIPKGLKIRMIEPLLVKKMFIHAKMTKGMTKKDVMKQFLLEKLQTGVITYPGDPETLTEHEVDAIAIGFVSHLFSLSEAAAS